MLKIEIKLVPFGLVSREKLLGTLEIVNKGGDKKTGNYVATDGVSKVEVEIENYPRILGWGHLVALAATKLWNKSEN